MAGSHFFHNQFFRVVAGAAAGNVTVTGIKTTDRLKAVFGFTLNEAAPPTFNVLNLTSEFTISAADTINNTGGTTSAGGILIVVADVADPAGKDLNQG